MNLDYEIIIWLELKTDIDMDIDKLVTTSKLYRVIYVIKLKIRKPSLLHIFFVLFTGDFYIVNYESRK